MKVEILKNTPHGTTLLYGGKDEEVTLLGTYTQQTTPGRYVDMAHIRLPDGRDCIVSATKLRDPLNPELTPPQQDVLLFSYQFGFLASLRGSQIATGRALCRLGLAKEHVGVWGSPLTELGRTVAERLMGKE